MIGRLALVCILVFVLAASPARAICSGASLDREFREADVVVRARLVSEIRAWDDEPSAAFRARWGDSGHAMLDRLAVLEVFKGRPGPRIGFFQEVNSGRFELVIDRDYLLFLNFIRPYPGRPSAARGAMYVSYACGQSRPWSDVVPGDLAHLRRLSARRAGPREAVSADP